MNEDRHVGGHLMKMRVPVLFPQTKKEASSPGASESEKSVRVDQFMPAKHVRCGRNMSERLLNRI